MASRDFLESFRTTPEAQKLLAAIRFAEGTKGPGDTSYYTLYGGSKTSDLSRHPDKVIKGGKYSSTAAGVMYFARIDKTITANAAVMTNASEGNLGKLISVYSSTG